MVLLGDDRDNSILELLKIEGIDDERANALYDAGYESIGDLKYATVDELIKVDYINPTIAQRLIRASRQQNFKQEIKHLDTDLKDSEIKNIEFVENPGKLKYIEKKALILLGAYYISFFCFIGIIIFTIYVYSIFLGISLCFIFPFIFLMIISFFFLYFLYYSIFPDFLRIYENGILITNRFQSKPLNPPRKYRYYPYIGPIWLFYMWRLRAKYLFVPFREIQIIYTIKMPFWNWKRMVILETNGKCHELFALPQNKISLIKEKICLIDQRKWNDEYISVHKGEKVLDNSDVIDRLG